MQSDACAYKNVENTMRWLTSVTKCDITQKRASLRQTIAHMQRQKKPPKKRQTQT